jgi:hypothetical protein
MQWIDVTSPDPQLLICLKSTRNTAQVPVHWAQKRKYLQGKRGMEKPPFELPGERYSCRVHKGHWNYADATITSRCAEHAR